ncbi:DUF421 domain-containing protein [Kineosporia corallincola]|nr:YetF domain-containing protein [Kineosporia corallincola]
MEIVVRAAVVWLFLWVITRAVGRATLGELSTFQLILFVTMGDMVQQGVTQQDYSVTGALLAVSTFAVITVAVSYANQRWRPLLPITHGVPIIVVRNGQPDLKALNGERMSVNDLFAAAREQGIRRIADVELAVLEANGKVSFFTESDDGSSGAPDPPEAG